MDVEIINELLFFIECEYQVDSQLIESGQRIVYLAHNTKSPGQVCILKASPVYPSNVARIQREITILKEINSPYFPQSLHSVFLSNEDIVNFIDNLDPRMQTEKIVALKALNLKPMFISVEEYIPHIELPIYLPLLKDEKKLIQYLRHIFQALDLLWAQKIVHRDLKPDNILVNENLIPTIIDLGIAKSFREGTMAITNPHMGSPCAPQFASPEQLVNKKAEVTYKSDQFSVGVVAYYILTESFPFGVYTDLGYDAFVTRVLANNITYVQERNTSVTNEMSDFIHRLLNIEPYKRFRNIESIMEEIDRIGA